MIEITEFMDHSVLYSYHTAGFLLNQLDT